MQRSIFWVGKASSLATADYSRMFLLASIKKSYFSVVLELSENEFICTHVNGTGWVPVVSGSAGEVFLLVEVVQVVHQHWALRESGRGCFGSRQRRTVAQRPNVRESISYKLYFTCCRVNLSTSTYPWALPNLDSEINSGAVWAGTMCKKSNFTSFNSLLVIF